MELAQRYNLYVVEDNVQSQGAAFDDQLTGTFGHLSGTSFYPGKNLGALGDAGTVTTNDATLDQKVQVLCIYGSQQKYYNKVVGYNSRLDEIQAAVLGVKPQHLPEWTRQRQQVATWYGQYLAREAGLRLPIIAPGATHFYHLHVVYTIQRDALQQHRAA